MDKIKVQANTVSQLVFSSETAATYKRMLTLTWDIVRETAILIWLVVCLVFVGADWFYRTSLQLGVRTREWYETLGHKSSGSDDASSMNATGKALLNAGQSGVTFLLTQARDQLGMKAPETPSTSQPAPETPKYKATPKAPSPSSAPPTVASKGEDVDSKA